MTRWKASATHLGLSALVVGVIGALLIWRWYPPGLFHLARADTLLLLIGGVDLVLGPLLTLIVFKSGKKSLKFDLSVIAAIQVAALLFGLHTVWQSRPVYLVASDERMMLLFAHEIEPADLARAAPAYRSLPAFGPKTVAVTVPDKYSRVVARRLGRDARLKPTMYHPYRDVAAKLAAFAVPVPDALGQLPPADRQTLQEVVAASGRPVGQLVVARLESSRGVGSMLLEAESGRTVRPMAIVLPKKQSKKL